MGVSENRAEGDGTVYTGTISGYNVHRGWGFVVPDNVESLPVEVQVKMTEAETEAEAKGKPIEPNMIYFRKPDLAEGFKASKGAAVTFSVYIDDKGVGACDINEA